MLQQRALELAQTMVRIPSVTFQEREAALYLLQQLQQLGFKTELDERNNVIARFRGKTAGKKLLFLGHHDTVEPGDVSLWEQPPFAGVVQNGLLYGRGSNDEKGGLASCLAALETFLAQQGDDFKGEILLVSTREETPDLQYRGIAKIPERRLTADYCICLEPSQMNILLGHKGRMVIELTTYGKPAHASLPQKGCNAVVHMVHLLTAVERMPLPYAPPLGYGTQSIGTITGGIRPNIVPECCHATIDRRVVGGETVESVQREFQRVITLVKQQIPALRAECNIQPPFYASYIEADSPLVRIAQKAALSVGYQPEVGYFPGHTDAEWTVNQLAIPTVILGPGDLATAHAANEVVPVCQLGQAAHMYYEILRQVLTP